MIDHIDHKIISMLQIDGRATLKKLSEKIGYTSMGVKKRLDKLLKERVIKISALININKLKCIPVMIFIEAESGEVIRGILKKFSDCPRIICFFTAIGEYNLIALMIAEDMRTLESISTEECSIRKIQGVKRIIYYPIGEIEYSPYLPVRMYLAGGSFEKAPCGVNCSICIRYNKEKCLGCPATKYYRGSLILNKKLSDLFH